MFISVLLLFASMMIFFSLRDRFNVWSKPLKYSVIGGLSLMITLVLTLEFFIYVHQRINEFKEAVKTIPTIFVILIFAGLFYAAWKFLFLLTRFSKEDFQKFIRESINEVKKTSRIGWQGLKETFGRSPFKKKTKDGETDVDEPSEEEH